MVGQACYIHYLTWSWPQPNNFAIIGPIFKRILELTELTYVAQSHKAKKCHNVCLDMDADDFEA